MNQMNKRRSLYPRLEPYDQGRLQVSDVHTLHYEQCGNPKGLPVVVIHGGPGGGKKPDDRRFFDPSTYRVILFDQRGCGLSTPHAELDGNTTWDLVADIEKLRDHLGIRTWHVFGGSWGSALGLAYAESHPDRVSALIMRGIFTLRREELLWFYQKGADALFPDQWERYVDVIPEEERGDMISAYYQRLTSGDEAVRLEAARAWSTWEGSTLSLLSDPGRVADFSDAEFALAFARIECHYFVNGGFFETDDWLIANVGKIRHIPGVIVQGRYDVVTPMMTAWALHKAWPEADFRVVPDAGHAGSEPGIIDELVRATDRLRSQPAPAAY
ncbi:prolyl aminopeptidase [Minwuia sp.]|uniref:prolyl aminopeptidase n=1 Tax=Minwuia sp. TaxID=2493630 RepID=UPI003A8F7A23